MPVEGRPDQGQGWSKPAPVERAPDPAFVTRTMARPTARSLAALNMQAGLRARADLDLPETNNAAERNMIAWRRCLSTGPSNPQPSSCIQCAAKSSSRRHIGFRQEWWAGLADDAQLEAAARRSAQRP